jgi:multisubunit Na+/H+ antiporter MnhE subunit
MILIYLLTCFWCFLTSHFHLSYFLIKLGIFLEWVAHNWLTRKSQPLGSR